MENSRLLPILGAAASLGLLAASLHLRRRHRLIADLPTTKASGVFIGLVELKGTAESEAPLVSHLGGRACVHFAWRVEERWSRTVTETYTDKDGNRQTRTRTESGWTQVAAGGQSQAFYLKDDTGAVLVRPEGARIEAEVDCDQTASRADPLYYSKGPAGAVPDSDHQRRFVETILPLHAAVFVVGHAQERPDVVAPEIAASKDAEMFLISTRSEEKVLRGYAAGSWVTWALGLGAAAGAAWGWAQPDAPQRATGMALAGAGAFGGLWLAGWTWMVFNSLVTLRQRVRQGWSLIEVQLQRRHDLIPRLATTVSALGAHEREVQTALAALRTQAEATPPGAVGPDPDGLTGTLRAVAEKYPALIAQPQFAALQTELVGTEQRIALARTYYNDLVTHFATRLERVPDGWVGRLGGMRAPPLLAGEAFERAPVVVSFAA